jgi:glycosyltransferase involved in cell wall biosynthesis
MLVSAIIPTYNRAATIERAVKSILMQSWRSMEVIVVDDGSTDGTAEVLTPYRDRINLICQNNRGPSAARNTGIKAAKGEIISFLDSDDTWLPDKTERQVRLLQATASSGVKCCVCNAKMMMGTRAVTSFARVGLRPTQREGVWINPAEVLINGSLFFNQVVAVRREMLEKTAFFREDLRIMEDYDLALRLSLMGPWAFIADPLVVWHGDAGNSLYRSAKQQDICQRVVDILEDLCISPIFGPLLPAVLLERRKRLLRYRLIAFHLSDQSNRFARLYGNALFLFLRGCEAVYRRLPSTPRMITRAV